MTRKQIEKDMLRMFETGSNKRNKSRWVQLVEAQGTPKRRGKPARKPTKKRR